MVIRVMSKKENMEEREQRLKRKKIKQTAKQLSGYFSKKPYNAMEQVCKSTL